MILQSFAAYFGADVCFESDVLGGEIKARRAVDAVAIEQSHGGHLILRAGGNQVFGQGSTFKKTEGGTSVELDVHRKTVLSSQLEANSPQSHPSTSLRASSDTERTQLGMSLRICVIRKTENWQRRTVFSHMFLPRTIRRRAGRGLVDTKQGLVQKSSHLSATAFGLIADG